LTAAVTSTRLPATGASDGHLRGTFGAPTVGITTGHLVPLGDSRRRRHHHGWQSASCPSARNAGAAPPRPPAVSMADRSLRRWGALPAALRLGDILNV